MRLQNEDRIRPKPRRGKRVTVRNCLLRKENPENPSSLVPAAYAEKARSGISMEASQLPGSDRPSFLHLGVRQRLSELAAGKPRSVPARVTQKAPRISDYHVLSPLHLRGYSHDKPIGAVPEMGRCHCPTKDVVKADEETTGYPRSSALKAKRG